MRIPNIVMLFYFDPYELFEMYWHKKHLFICSNFKRLLLIDLLLKKNVITD